MSLLDLAGSLISPITNIIDKSVKDKDLAAKLKHEIDTQGFKQALAQLEAQRSIIVAEAQGSWLAANWRPITMLVFVLMLAAYWFGFVPVNLSQEDRTSVFELVKIGLGGYVVGRSCEKVAKNWKNNA